MQLQVGRAMVMLLNGLNRDPQAAVAGVLMLSYGASLGGVMLMRWGDASAVTGTIRLGDDYLPLTPAVVEVLADYADRVEVVGGARMLAERGHSVRVRELVARIADLTDGWYPASTLRDWARQACPELLYVRELRRAVEEFAQMGATPEQCRRLRNELERRRCDGIVEWHRFLGWCVDETTRPCER